MNRNADTVLDTIVDLHRRHLGLGAEATGTRRGRHNRNLTQLREALGVGRWPPQPGRNQRDGERAGSTERSHAPVIDGNEGGVSAWSDLWCPRIVSPAPRPALPSSRTQLNKPHDFRGNPKPFSDFVHCTVVHHARPDADPHARPAHDELRTVRIDVEDKTFDRSVSNSWVHSICSIAARTSGSAPCVSWIASPPKTHPAAAFAAGAARTR